MTALVALGDSNNAVGGSSCDIPYHVITARRSRRMQDPGHGVSNLDNYKPNMFSVRAGVMGDLLQQQQTLGGAAERGFKSDFINSW